jgi:hypothetical protein
MSHFIFDAGGTGFSRKMAARLIDAPRDTSFLDGLGDIGDEIMMLDGLGDLGDGAYDTGPAGSITPPWNGETAYDFGVDGFMLRGLRGKVGGLASTKGFAGTMGNLGTRPRGRLGLRGRMAIREAGIDGLGDMSPADCSRARSIASGIANTCRSACALADTEADRQRCRAGCDTAYNAALIPIEAACAGGGTATTSTMTQEQIDAKLRQLEQQSQMAQTGQYAQMAQPSNTTTYLVVGGIVAVGLIGAVLIARSRG